MATIKAGQLKKSLSGMWIPAIVEIARANPGVSGLPTARRAPAKHGVGGTFCLSYAEHDQLNRKRVELGMARKSPEWKAIEPHMRAQIVKQRPKSLGGER